MSEGDRQASRSVRAGIGAIGGGVLTALALPPWGWWPLAIVGVAVLYRLLGDRPARSRFIRGLLFGIGWLGPGMGWMWFLTPPGYVVATLLFATFVAGAALVSLPGPQRYVTLPLAMVLVEAARLCFPFGGVPLATLAIGQAAGPLAPLARVGGVLAVGAATMVAGGALEQASRRAWRPAVWSTLAVAGALVLAGLAPSGSSAGRSVRIAVVQGGGPQGTHAVTSDARAVVARHLAATATITGGVDMVLWPENVVDVADFASSPERAEVAAQAARLGVPLVIGITEDTSATHFVNAQVVVMPDGTMASRYEKVRRVPFGEFMPMRGLLKALGAPVDRVPRDAVAGHDPAVVDVPLGADRPAVVLGVAISWEVFFGGRVRDGVKHGAAAVLNPTNGSSYTGTVLQTQQIASSKLRAIESGRWVVQAAPTGFSGFISPVGEVHQRTAISERKVVVRSVPLRRGRTWYTWIGDVPIAEAAAFGLLSARLLARRRRVTGRPTVDTAATADPAVDQELTSEVRPAVS